MSFKYKEIIDGVKFRIKVLFKTQQQQKKALLK